MKENVEPNDEGIYESIAENDVSLTKWRSVKVNVVGKRLHGLKSLVPPVSVLVGHGNAK